MAGIMTKINLSLKQLLNLKGQGLVEFALICALGAALGLTMRDAGFKASIYDTFQKSKPDLLEAAILNKHDRTYQSYFNDWRDIDSVTLDKYDNTERIKADQKALIKIAETYLGKNQSQILDLMNYYSNSPNSNQPAYVTDLQCENDSGTGFSKGMLVPLSYKKNSLDSEGGYLWLEANNNQNTVRYLAEGSVVYDKYDKKNPTYNDTSAQGGRKTIVQDRLFYSHDMLTGSQVTVSLKLHYTDNEVDKIAISVRNGTKDSKAETIGQDLCLLVTNTGYEVVQQKTQKKDIVRETPSVYADIWNVADLQ